MSGGAAAMPATGVPSSTTALLRLGACTIATSLSLGLSFLTVTEADAGRIGASAAVWDSVGLLLMGVVASFALTARRDHPHPIEIRSVYLLYSAVGFGGLALAWVEQQTGTAGRIDQASVPRAVLVALIGIVAWSAGYAMVRGEPAKRFTLWCRRVAAPGTAWTSRSAVVPLVLYMIGVGARGLRIGQGAYGYIADPRSLIANPSSFGQLLPIAERLTLISITVAAVNVARRSERSIGPLVLLVALVVIEICTTAYGGTKSALISIGIAVVVPLLARRRRVPLSAVALIVVFVVASASFVETYRAGLISGTTRLGGTSARDAFLAAAGETLNPARVDDTVSRGIDNLGKRLRQIDNVAIITQRTPSEIPFRPATELITDPVADLVPRALWPGKPVKTTGLDFSQQYYDLPPGLYTSSAVTVVGDLYRHGGLLVVVLALTLLGAAAHYSDRYWHPAGDLRLSVLFAATFVEIINIEYEATSLVTSLVVAIGLSIVATRAAFVRIDEVAT